MRAQRKFLTIAITCLLSVSVSSFHASADPSDVFPSGPYDANLISASILYPSLFGVNKGLPVADVSGVLMPNGTIRAFVFAQNKGIEIADSTDGKVFTRVGNAFGGDRGQGMPRVIKLSDGRFRMYNSTSEGVSCSISSDGLNFTLEKTTCISKTSFAAATKGLTSPGIVKLSDGRYRAFFSDMVIAGTGPDPHQVFSATSTDGLTWTADSGVRIGIGATNITRSAEHPAAAIHPDGSITLFFYDNAARGGKDAMGMPILESGAQGLWYATSTDGGKTFQEETISNLPFTPNDKVFFGDYLGISAVNGIVRPIWPRMDEGKITLWTAIIDQKNEPKQKTLSINTIKLTFSVRFQLQ